MINYSVEISETAQIDLVEIYRYIFNKILARDTAKKIVSKIREMIYGLNKMLERYPLSRNVDLAKEGIRLMPVGNFHVFYFVEDSRVVVARVMYGKRDVELNKGFPLNECTFFENESN